MNTEKNIISIPNENLETAGQYLQFGYYETQGNFRSSQEDALVRHLFVAEEWMAEGSSSALTPLELAHRLWTCYRQLDQQVLDVRPHITAGSTAITILYDGRGNLITALLGDAAAFAVVYDSNEQVLGVERLNTVTHKPVEACEQARIEASGGFVSKARVDGILAISRAIGDSNLKKSGVSSEAHISIVSIMQLLTRLDIPFATIGKIQIIACCDGFTDAAGSSQTKISHEAYLLQALRKEFYLENISESALAEYLVKSAIEDGSTDNISVAIQTITKDSPRCLLGVYDGHGGNEASIYIACHIGALFKELCSLSHEAYTKHPLSVSQNRDVYLRDNSSVEGK